MRSDIGRRVVDLILKGWQWTLHPMLECKIQLRTERRSKKWNCKLDRSLHQTKEQTLKLQNYYVTELVIVNINTHTAAMEIVDKRTI